MQDFTPLNFGKWMMPDWNGGVLRLSELLIVDSPEKQYQITKSFFNSGIKILLEKLG
jgi:hypothetical protein